MSYWWAWLLFAGWWAIGTWASVKMFRYEQDLTVGDLLFCVLTGMILGAFNLIGLLFVWEDNRGGGPKVIARKIDREDRDYG